MELFDFIREQPGGTAHADWMFAAIDKHALKVGATLKRLYPHVEELRQRQGSPNIKARCNQIADALERDPTGRLVAIPELLAWADKDDGPGMHWVRWYKRHLEDWLAQQSQLLIAAE